MTATTDPSKPHSRLSSAIASLTIIALVAVALHRLLFSASDQLLWTDDVRSYFFPIHHYIKEQLLAGHLPLWNPYIYAGTPLAANPQATLFYPPAWLALLLPVITTQKLLIVLHIAAAGLFMFALLRRLGLSPAIAAIASLPWTLGSYMTANAAVGHLTMLFTAAWLPAAIYCCEHAIADRRWRWTLLAGVVLGIQVLAGEPQNSYYTVLAVVIFVITRSLLYDISVPTGLRHGIVHLARIALIAAGICAVQLLPTLELARQSDRSSNSADYAMSMSFQPTSLIGCLIPWSPDARAIGLLHDDGSITEINTNWEFACYVGILPLILAGIGLFTASGGAWRAIKIIAVVGIVLALGRTTPIYAILLKSLPGLHLFRIPGRALLLVTFALSALSGAGLHWTLEHDHRRNWRWKTPAFACVFAAIVTLLALNRFNLYGLQADEADNLRWVAGEHSPVVFPLILCLITVVLLILTRWLSAKQALIAIATVIAIDLLIATPHFPLKQYAIEHDPDIQAFIAARDAIPPGSRVDFPPQISANAGMIADVPNINGYWPLAVGRFYHFVHAMRGIDPEGGDHHELNESLYTTPDAFPLRILNVARTAQLNQAGVKFIDNPHPMPCAWLVSRVEVLTEDQAIERLKDPKFDPHQTALLDHVMELAAAASPGISPGTCQIDSISAQELRLTTRSDRDALLILSEIAYPGWHLTIDDKSSPLITADLILPAAKIPAGEHRIRYWYSPAGVWWGMAISATTVVFTFAAIAYRRRRIAIGRLG